MSGKGKAGESKGTASKGKNKPDKKGDKDEDDAGKGKVKGCQQINVRHILTEKHGKKEEAVEKLKNGEKFDEVAKTMSEDKARNGGSLGWKRRAELDPAFEAAAFELEASTTTKPKYVELKTEFGYHIIMVEGRK